MNWLTVALIPVGGNRGNGGTPPAWAIALLVVVCLAFPAFIIVGSILQARRKRQAHETNVASGVPMAATVILLSQHPTVAGVFDVTLQVAHPHGAFVVLLRSMIPLQNLLQLQVGATVPVRVAALDNVELAMPGVSHV